MLKHLLRVHLSIIAQIRQLTIWTCMSHAHHHFLKQKVFLQLVGVFCKGLLPGLLPLVWSIALLKASMPLFVLCLCFAFVIASTEHVSLT